MPIIPWNCVCVYTHCSPGVVATWLPAGTRNSQPYVIENVVVSTCVPYAQHEADEETDVILAGNVPYSDTFMTEYDWKSWGWLLLIPSRGWY